MYLYLYIFMQRDKPSPKYGLAYIMLFIKLVNLLTAPQ